MDRLKKALGAVLIITLVLLPLAGCQDKGDHPHGHEHPSEHPAKEALVEDAAEAVEEAVAEEAPAPEHPEHPG